MKIYNKKDQAESGKIQNVQVKEKRSTRKLNEVKSCIQGNKQIKENPDVR